MEPSVQNIIASAEVTTSRRGSFWVGLEPVPGPLRRPGRIEAAAGAGNRVRAANRACARNRTRAGSAAGECR